MTNKNNPDYVDTICKRFHDGADLLLAIYNKNSKSFTYKQFADYNTCFMEDYYIHHIQVKNVVDFLNKELLEKYFPKLEAARVHAQPVFSKEVGYMRNIARYISKETDYQEKHILQCFVDELSAFWRDGKNLPDIKILENRHKNCVIFFENGQIQSTLVGKEIVKFSQIFLRKSLENLYQKLNSEIV